MSSSHWKQVNLYQLVDKNIKLVASGASDYKPDNGWIDWNDYVLTHMAGNIDYLSGTQICNRGVRQ